MLIVKTECRKTSGDPATGCLSGWSLFCLATPFHFDAASTGTAQCTLLHGLLLRQDAGVRICTGSLMRMHEALHAVNIFFQVRLA